MFHAFIDVFGAVFEHPIDQDGEFVCHSGNGFGHAELGDQATKVCSQSSFAVAQRACGQTQRGAERIDDFAAFAFEDFATADVMVGAQAQPRRRTFFRRPRGRHRYRFRRAPSARSAG